MRYYCCELRSIDTWKDCDGLWYWNDSCNLENDIWIEENSFTPRRIFKMLRNGGYLTEYSKGKVKLEECWPVFEIQLRSNNKPIFALLADETHTVDDNPQPKK